MESFKFLASVIVGFLGLYFLIRGKKIQSPRFMVLGGILLALSYLIYM